MKQSPNHTSMTQEELSTFFTKNEFSVFTRHIDDKFEWIDQKFEAIDKRFDEFRDILIETTNHLATKIDNLSARIDSSVKQNALEHHSFDVKLNILEGK